MSQITTGTVFVQNGNATVEGNDTQFVTDGVSVGDLFIPEESLVSYEVASVTNETELELTAPYQGTTIEGAEYVIHTSFTPNKSYPFPETGDFETATIVKRAIKQIDEDNYMDGNVSSTDNAIILWDGTEGTSVKDGPLIDKAPSSETVPQRNADSRVRSASGGSDDEVVVWDDTSATPEANKLSVYNTDIRLESTSGGSGNEVLVNADKTGADITVVSGTAGIAGNIIEWDEYGDAVDSDFSVLDFALEEHTHTLADITDSGTAAALDTGTAAAQIPTNADLPNSSAVGNDPNQLVKFEDDGEGGPQYPAGDGSQLTGFTAKVVGEVFHLALRKSASTSFPALRLTGEIQTITDATWPLLVPELRDVKAYYRNGETEIDTFGGSVTGNILTLDDNPAENELVEALAEDFLFSGEHKSITLDDFDWQIEDVDPVTREITVFPEPPDGVKTVELHPYRIAGNTGAVKIGKADGIVLAGVGSSGRMAGLATRDRMQQITGSVDGVWQNLGSDVTSSGALVRGAQGTAQSARATSGSNDTTELDFDSSDSPDARTGTTTRDRSLGVELYIYGGQYDG